MKKIVLVFTMLLLLIGCSSYRELLVKIPPERTIKETAPSGKSIVLYFGRDSCPNCKQFFPKLKKIMNKKKMTLYYYDIDEHRQDEKFKGELNRYQVKEIPYVMIYKNETIVDTLIGDKSEAEIKEFLEKAL